MKLEPAGIALLHHGSRSVTLAPDLVLTNPQPDAAPCRNCLVYGTEATGKSAVVAALLRAQSDAHHAHGHMTNPGHGEAEFQYAIINAVECITGRHLFETTIRKVAHALGLGSLASPCENLAQLTFELSRMLKYPPQPERRNFVLVFDDIGRQREAPPTLLPALARLSETVRCPPPPIVFPRTWYTERSNTKQARPDPVS